MRYLSLLLALFVLVWSPAYAATDLSGEDGPVAASRVTCDGTAGNVEAVTFAGWVKTITITFLQSDQATADTGAIAFGGTDGAAIQNDRFPIGSGGALEVRLTSRTYSGTLYVACGTNSGYAYIIQEG